jgi:hypothetical protein
LFNEVSCEKAIFDLRAAAAGMQPAAPMITVGRERVLFAGAAFLSASLLFSSEPMMGRMLAPLLGGAPAVWNTCLVFFQVVLLLGYLYSHLVATRFSARAQRWAQVILLALACVALPLGIPPWARENVPADAPVRWLLGTLTITVGLPFFALSTLAPLLQSWLGRRGRSPFFLYAASNAGSLLALLLYPVAVEPLLRMADQVVVWMVGFLILIPLVWMAGEPVASAVEEKREDSAGVISWRRRLLWLALAFVPSSLLQGVTSYLSADIASLPLLWVIPLALYLLTFVIAFSESIRVSWQKLDWALAVGAVCLVLLLAIEASQPAWLMMLMHLGFFTVASLFCHVRLSQDRPSPARLTEFYLWMAVGGAAGGLFNALIAPNIFSRIVEYPLAILLACLLRSGLWRVSLVERVKDISYAIVFANLIAAAAFMLRSLKGESMWPSLAFGAMALACFFMKNQPLRFALSVAAVLAGGAIAGSKRGQLVHVERNFFGVLRVTETGPFYRLYHGTTVHGMQRISDPKRCEPLAYYYPGGGLHRMLELAQKGRSITNVAVVGLGAGSAVSYAQPHQHWSIYEIDPAVVRIASDSKWFSFLKCSGHPPLEYFVGDARLLLGKAPARKFDFMIMDAFSSDSVPMHLLTREAMRMYLEKLAPGGLIAMHVSSRNLRLEPVVANVAAAEGLECYEPAYVQSPDEIGTFSASWLLLARPAEGPDVLKNSREWRRLVSNPKGPVWTDDFLNLWSVIAFN